MERYMGNSNRKVILITGASSGLGKVCAGYLSQRGHRVFGTSRHPPSQKQVGSLNMVQMDVNSSDSISRAIDYILEKEGRLDVVLNNAGFGMMGSVEDTSIDEAKSLFETNFWGVVRVCRAVLPVMRDQEYGYIVNISSIGGQIGLPFRGLYSASKFAIEGMTEALRMEVRPFGIHVVLVEPGNLRTKFVGRHKTSESQRNQVYAEKLNNVLRIIERDETHGPSPDMIAQLVERIIRNPSPRLRYTVGATPGKQAITLKKIVPDRFFEWLLMKYYRLR
jgi:NAD(P)-dependent dehydrogenase (short-subunit alcohol dehydrogenase family)